MRWQWQQEITRYEIYMSLPESVDVLIVGAGHVGLAMSSFLTEARREHLVVERHDGLGGPGEDCW
jgi:cation diffusion facilitator CzcD-associated flavoprotein CzcO